MTARTRRLRAGRVELDLHTLQPAPAKSPALPLLLLHGLRESSRVWGSAPAEWPGAVHALDFSGHGSSARVLGGALQAELLVSDADVAVAAIGDCAIAGRGLGAYIALLLAGTRSEAVAAALLMLGPGLEGGGETPNSDARPLAPYDPVLVARAEIDPCLERYELDPRPQRYVRSFASQARALIWQEDGSSRPDWWHAAREAGPAPVITARPTAGLAALAKLAPSR